LDVSTTFFKGIYWDREVRSRGFRWDLVGRRGGIRPREQGKSEEGLKIVDV